MRAKVDVGYEIPGFYDFFDFSNDFTRSDLCNYLSVGDEPTCVEKLVI